MNPISFRQLLRSHRLISGGVWGGVVATLISGAGLLPALLHRSSDAVLALGIALVSGIGLGALIAGLYQTLGRVRFWSVLLVVETAGLIGMAVSPQLDTQVMLPLWLGALGLLGLTIWVLLAWGLHQLRQGRPKPLV